jgi:predicted pyridoxine 5'-phosphate oxidase superfamily flavin-nucleotide-binding protein
MATGKKLNATLRAFIERQLMFFVATADVDGRVNMSPKGMDTLRIVNDNRISWLNLSGSGNETAAHVQATGRMTMMFCAFDGDPLILRVYGTASLLHPRDDGWDGTVQDFPKLAGSRQIFSLDIDLVQTSCGTGVPVMEFQRSRGEVELEPFYDDMGADGVLDYWGRKNVTTIDGKPTGVLQDIE